MDWVGQKGGPLSSTKVNFVYQLASLTSPVLSVTHCVTVMHVQDSCTALMEQLHSQAQVLPLLPHTGSHYCFSYCYCSCERKSSHVILWAKQKIEPDQVEGRGKTRKLHQVWIPDKNAKILDFTPNKLNLPFESCYMVFPWPWFIIYTFTSFTGYADDIFNVISNFHIKRF